MDGDFFVEERKVWNIMCTWTKMVLFMNKLLNQLGKSDDEPCSFILPYTCPFLLFYHFPHITDPLLHTPLTWPPMQASTIICLCSISLASLTWWTDDILFTCYISFLSYLTHPPTAWPITNHCATQSGTYYSFTSYEPCAHFLDYHLYLTHLQITKNTSFPQISDFVFALPHFASGDYPLPPYCTLRASLGLCLDYPLHPILATPLEYHWAHQFHQDRLGSLNVNSNPHNAMQVQQSPLPIIPSCTYICFS